MSAYNDFKAITPSNTTDLSRPSEGIYVGTGGAVSVTSQSGATVVFSGVPAGAILPIKVARVTATGTDASNLIALNRV